MKTITPSDHAGADLRISNPARCKQFIERLNVLGAPLPWGSNELGQVYDADGDVVCDVSEHITNGWESVAEMIVLAVNTCGSFKATRRVEPKTD